MAAVKTLLAVAVCMAAMFAVAGLLMCMASSMVSQKEEKMNSKYKEENNYEW